MLDPAFAALTAERLGLRRFRPQDLDTFVADRSNPEIARNQNWEAPYRPSQARQFCGNCRPSIRTARPTVPVRRGLGRTDRLVGDCAAHVQADDPRQAKIGSTRAPEHQGDG